MSYAKLNNGQGWRAVSCLEDCTSDETYSETEPVLEPTKEQVTANLMHILQNHLDKEAQTKGYDDIKSAALRSAYPGPFRKEGAAAGTWMDTCFALVYKIIDDIESGTIEIPSESEFTAMLPKMIWK